MAIVFGVISPKINKISVILPVTIDNEVANVLSAVFANTSIMSIVAIADAPTFAILLPIKIAVSNLWGSCNSFSNFLDDFIFCSTSVFSLARLIAVKAVSALEKKAEKNKKPINGRALIMILLSKSCAPNGVNFRIKNCALIFCISICRHRYKK